jgi:hypothetical protein
MKFRALTPQQAWPDQWKDKLVENQPISIGIDPATTTKKLSNPTAIVVTQKVGFDYFVRAAIRFKTDDPAVTRAMLGMALDVPKGCRIRKIVVLATSERFFATDLRSHFAGKAPVQLVIESEKASYRGEEMTYKLYLGNLVVNMLNDANLTLPNAVFVRNDLRQPEGATFIAEPDESGNHADVFCALGASLHGLVGAGGPVAAAAVAVSKIAGPKMPNRKLLNPYAYKFGAPRTRSLVGVR